MERRAFSGFYPNNQSNECRGLGKGYHSLTLIASSKILKETNENN